MRKTQISQSVVQVVAREQLGLKQYRPSPVSNPVPRPLTIIIWRELIEVVDTKLFLECLDLVEVDVEASPPNVFRAIFSSCSLIASYSCGRDNLFVLFGIAAQFGS